MNCSSCNMSQRKSGRKMYQCDHCKRWFCSKCGSKGQRCPSCRKGFLS